MPLHQLAEVAKRWSGILNEIPPAAVSAPGIFARTKAFPLGFPMPISALNENPTAPRFYAAMRNETNSVFETAVMSNPTKPVRN